MLTPVNINDTNYIIQQITTRTNCMTSFATKIGRPSNVKKLEEVKPDTARIRMSVSPQVLANKLEVATSKIIDRLNGVEVALELGYEVHLNFSPIVLYTGWVKDYIELLLLIDQILSTRAKQQLKCEVIFLTHSEKLHKSNLNYFPEAEELLWTPKYQEAKCNKQEVLRYKAFTTKKKAIALFTKILGKYLPYCPIRYIF